MTDSTDFPTMNPIQTKMPVKRHVLSEAKCHRSASSTRPYLGGSDRTVTDDRADARGNLYFEAWTSSTDIPTANASQTKVPAL